VNGPARTTINLANYPVLKRPRKRPASNVYLWQSLGGGDANIFFNYTFNKDPDLNKLINTRFPHRDVVCDQP
jgi:hypothetical protein